MSRRPRVALGVAPLPSGGGILPVVDELAVALVVVGGQVAGVLEQVVQLAAGVLHVGDPAVELDETGVGDVEHVAAGPLAAFAQVEDLADLVEAETELWARRMNATRSMSAAS